MRTESEPTGGGMDAEATPVTFTKAELWLLQRFIRHEVPALETWHFPPAAMELNDQIADALLFCEDEQQEDATLQLSWGDCLAIDFCVPNDVKDVNGAPIGRKVLLKTYAARSSLRRGYPYVEVPQPAADPAKADVTARLSSARWDDDSKRFQPNDDPGHNAGN